MGPGLLELLVPGTFVARSYCVTVQRLIYVRHCHWEAWDFGTVGSERTYFFWRTVH